MKTKYFKLNPDLSIKKLPNYVRLFKGSLIFNLILIMTVSYAFTNPKIKYIQTVRVIEKEIPEDITLNDSSLVRELKNANVAQIAIAVAQAKLETGHYKSLVCRENKNLFGIKYHKCKYVAGNKNNHACYNTYRDNIKCYAHVQSMYLKQIDGKYAESPVYIQQLKQIR